MPDTARRRWLVASWAIALTATDAEAFDAFVDADLSVQLYQLSNPWQTTTLERRRFTHTLAVRGMNLTSADDPLSPHVDAVVRARVNADIALAPGETDSATLGQYVPGLRQAPTDLMVAYLEGRRFLDGHAGFRLGRQYVVDVLGWWSFDGAQVRIDTPAHVAVEVYGGAEQRGGPPTLSTSRFEADGVLRGDRTGLNPGQWPEYLDGDALAPAIGAAIEASGLPFLQARATYRKVINRDTVVTSPLPGPDNTLSQLSSDRTSTERAGVAATLTGPSLGSVSASGVYDLYLGAPSEHAVDASWFALTSLTVGAGYRYYLPTYDADSIFNWFSRHGTTRFEGRLTWSPARQWDLGLSAGGRQFAADSDDGTTVHAVNAAGSLSVTRRHATGQISGRLLGEGLALGRQLGGEVTARQTFSGGRHDALLRASLFDWDDELRSSGRGVGTTYVIGLGTHPMRWARTGVQWEHSMNTLVGHRIRLLATLEVTFQ